LGCGGHSRLGLPGKGIDHAAGIVRAAYEAGVNFFDTAAAYGTEGAVGKGLEGIPRDAYVLSTKFPYPGKAAGDFEQSLHESLRQLKTEYVDVYHLHGVKPDDYPRVRDTFVPLMLKAKQEGKIRFLGITEHFGTDTSHRMFADALAEDIFDVAMVGYNLLNPSAAKSVFPLTLEKNLGVLCMFAVRSALSNPRQLAIDIERILEHGQADPALVKAERPLDFLVRAGAAASIMEAAYRFCRHTPGVGVTLTGTGSAAHLRENLLSIQGPKLPEEILARLGAMFGGVDCVSGQ
jgi:aryl-alcohol dehydrogenase-like predicted oxidoreductase